VIDAEYTRRYFSEGAGRWLATAYGAGEHPVSYPVGERRVRLALAAVAERVRGGRLIDLGCGGGELCVAAAQLGFEVTGIDVAEGMIAEAEIRRGSLPPAQRERLTFRVGDALEVELPGGTCDAVTALGLLEYLDDDGALLRAAARWLRPGGVLVVSCRNRLFNLASLNAYTRREIEGGAALDLLAELSALTPDHDVADRLDDFVARLREALPALEAALAADRTASGASPRGERFAGRRRQHTPHALAAAASAAGFRAPAFVGVHPHPFPPALEAAAPRFYNRLAMVWEAFETSPVSLAWSSAFLGVFSR
jgi:2-polyprenyl-3-methyl-5-hydroxy-6-metoxy-1,4-benzoquinol methylase